MQRWICLLAMVVGCSAAGEDETTTDETEEALSNEPASTYNANPFKPTNGAVPYECIWPAVGANSSTPAHWYSGQTAFFSWRSLDFSGTTCAPGQLRVARWERLKIGGQNGYVMRGAGGFNADEVYGNSGIRFGHVLASELEKETSVLEKYIPGKVGQAPASCSGTLYTNDPAGGTTFDLSGLYYKPNQQSSSGAKWDNYGNQSGWGPTPYNYLLWTWPVRPNGGENAGGGQIRATITQGQSIRACNVAPVYLPMYPANSSDSVGRFKMMYGRVRNGDGAVAYGWFALAWQYKGSDWHYFVN